MKKILVVIGLVFVVLGGCSGEVEDQQKENDGHAETNTEKVREEIERFLVNRDSFHFLVDWLSNEEVLFVEKAAESYRLNAFNIYSQEIRLVYEEEDVIADVFIHPTKEALLVHTTALQEAATVKMVTLDGVVHNEITLESSELAIEWNDMNKSYLLVTAFYEDWSYDTFFFDCSLNELTLLSIESPFPKWFGTNQFLFKDTSNHDGLFVYDIETSKKESFIAEDVVFYDTFKETLFIAQATADEQMRYTLLNREQKVRANWTAAGTVQQDTRYIAWLEEDSVLLLQPEKGKGQATSTYELVRYDVDRETVLIGDLLNTELICSPDGQKCITGYSLENMLMLEEKTVMPWLQYTDE